MQFGLGVPTCREGLAYPTGSITPAVIREVAAAADDLGYDAVWANQHLVTQRVLADVLSSPPNYYDPIVTLAYLAGTLRRARLVLASVVGPAWPPILLAKQLATLDQLSGGRVTAGLGIGAYREEVEAVLGPHRARGARLEELVGALRAIWSSTSASFEGDHLQFSDVQSWPRPKQRPLPIHLAANSSVGIARAARLADGWLVANRTVEQLTEDIALLRSTATAVGRSPDEIEVCLQVWVSVGATEQAARVAVADSQHLRRLRHLTGRSTNDLLNAFAETNLLGTPEQVIERLEVFQRAGVDHVGMVFLAPDTVGMLRAAHLLAAEVLPELRAGGVDDQPLIPYAKPV